jgi:hypothetical protein
MENLQSALIDIERQVDVLEGILENKVQRSLTVLQNAYTEGKQATAKIRASTQGVQIASPPSPFEGEVADGEGLENGRGAGKVKASEKVSTVSTGAGEIASQDLSTETLRLALLDPVQ